MQKLFQSKTWKEAIKELINTYIDKDEYGKKESEEHEKERLTIKSQA